MRARIISMMVLAASLIAASQAWAQSDGSVTFGGGYWTQSNPEAKFNEYRDLPRGAFLGDYVLRNFSGPWAAMVWGDAPTRGDQMNSLYLAKGVTWRLDASYSGVPHLFSEVAHTPYAQNTKGVFTLSDSLQRTLQNLTQTTANPAQNRALADLLASAPGVDLGLQTNVTKARLRGRPVKDWQFEVKGSDRERTGSQALGATLGGPGGPTVELPAPIDQRMLDVDATGTYAHGPAKIYLDLGMSSFTNRISTIKFDNFKVFNSTYSSRSAVNAMSTAPDNDVLRARIGGMWQLPYASTFTATIGVSQTSQKQDFLPMTVNDTIRVRARVGTDSLALPRANLDGKVTEIVQDYRLTGRPLKNFYGTLRFRQEKFDDKTDPLALPYGFINYDLAWSRGAVETESASNTKTVYGFDGDYELTSQADVSVMVERRQRELPDWREVTKDAENVFGAKVRVRPLDGAEAAVGYTVGQRRMDSFILDAYDGAEWDTFRRYDVADRDQTKIDGEISWSGSKSYDVSVNAWYNQDKYPNSPYGLQKVDNTQVFAEGTWHATKLVDVTGGFGYGEQKGTQASIEDPNAGVSDTMSVAPWTALLDDKNNYAFARIDCWSKNHKYQLTTEYTFIRDMITYDFSHYFVRSASGILLANVASTTAIDINPSLSRTNDVALTGTWHYSPQMDLALMYGFTQYDYRDPLYTVIPYLNVNPTAAGTAASGIFLGNNRMGYSASRLQVRATRRF